jgi:uncharacterized protein (TIGR02722 family)
MFLLGAGLIFLTGCASTVKYGDANDVKPLDTDFGAGDLQQIAQKMTGSLLTFPPIVQITRDRRPVLIVERVKNKTTQHIDTESITDTIRTKLIRSGKFRFLDKSTDSQTISEIKRQQEEGLTRQDQARQFGTQEAAEYELTASLSEISQRAHTNVLKKEKSVYYKFTMNLKNINSGILEWSDEKEISKEKITPFISW